MGRDDGREERRQGGTAEKKGREGKGELEGQGV